MTGQVLHIHVGLPKTGTTALQRFLAENRDRLAARGLLVPGTGQRKDGPHHPLLLRLARPGLRRRRLAALLAEIRGSGLPAAVISSEYAPVLFRLSLLPLALRRLRAAGLRLRFHAFLRPQPDFLNSAYPEFLRSTLEWRSFEDFVAERGRRAGRGYLPLVAALERHADAPPVLHPFTGAARRAGIWKPFLEGLGVDPAAADWVPPGEANPSLGPVGTHVVGRVVKRIAKRGLIRGFANRQALRERIRAATLDFPREAEPFRGLDGAERMAIWAAEAAPNEALARRFWGRGWDEVFAEERAETWRSNLYRPGRGDPARDAMAEVMLDAAWTACRRAMRRYEERHAGRRLADRLADPFDRLLDMSLRLALAHG